MPEVVELTSENRSFGIGNFIDVPTLANGCGYYVLARRMIHDNYLPQELVNGFNQFYTVNWHKTQLADVLGKLPLQDADVLLGLAIRSICKVDHSKGLEVADLGALCKRFSYNLYLYQQQQLPETVASSLFINPWQQSQHRKEKEIYVFLKVEESLGHYYLLEPDGEKAEVYKATKPTQQCDYRINWRGGAELETKLSDIKQSVNQINETIITAELFQQLPQISSDKKQQIARDKHCAFRLLIKEIGESKSGFFKLTKEQRKKAAIKLQREAIAHWNACKKAKDNTEDTQVIPEARNIFTRG